MSLEIIRVSIARGDYETALASFLAIPNVESSPRQMSSLGKVYRKLGRLSEARAAYWKAQEIKPDYLPAEAGLAECVKQTAHFQKAIRRYHRVLSQKEKLTDESHKVYRFALSYVYRLNRNYSASEHLLNELLAEYPMESNIRFHLCKLYTILGRTENARQEFSKIQVKDLDRAAVELYFTAIGRSRFNDQDMEEYSSDILKFTAPDQQGLVNSNWAFHAIKQNKFERARDLLNGTTHNDRLEFDFAQVLKFHATKSIDASFNYKSDWLIARIGKRGHPELKSAVHAIAAERYDEAVDLEEKMCLIVA